MPHYWCKFFNAGGHVFGNEKMEAADDAAAVAKARVVFATGIVGGYEIWHEKRLVHREDNRGGSKYC